MLSGSSFQESDEQKGVIKAAKILQSNKKLHNVLFSANRLDNHLLQTAVDTIIQGTRNYIQERNFIDGSKQMRLKVGNSLKNAFLETKDLSSNEQLQSFEQVNSTNVFHILLNI